MITLRLRVWGLVQGVGFRFYTKRLADQLQISGMVKIKSMLPLKSLSRIPRREPMLL